MSIFGKDHKFCITTFSCPGGECISSSQQDNTENHDYINYVLCQLYAVYTF